MGSSNSSGKSPTATQAAQFDKSLKKEQTIAAAMAAKAGASKKAQPPGQGPPK